MNIRRNERTDPEARTGIAVGVIILLAYYTFFAWKNRNFELDDALIYLRYIKNFIEGHGLVYNEGVSFNGLTSPLFTYLLAIAAWLARNVKLISWALSAAFIFLAALSMWAVFRRQLRNLALQIPEVFIFPGALLFLSLPYFYMTYGMETGLFTLLSALLIYFAITDRFYIVGPLSALLFLTRSEGIFLVAAVGIVYVYQHRALPRFDWRTYLLPVAIIAACWSFNYFYYGHIMAETGMAKIWQGKSGLWGERWNFLEASYLLDLGFAGHYWPAYILITFALLGVVALGTSHLNLVIIIYVALYTAFYLALNIPNYHWYYSPYFAFLPFYAMIGVGFAARKMASMMLENYRRNVLVLATVGAFIPVLVFSQANSVERGTRDEYKSLGLYLSEHTPSDSVIAAVEIGVIGFYADRHIVDILGLVNPYNAKFIGERDFDEWLKHYKVNYIIAHKPIWNHELSVFSLAGKSGLHEVCDIAQPVVGLYRVLDESVGIESCNGERWLPTDVVQSASGTTAAGYVDSVEIVGNFVRLQGWATTENGAFTSLGFGHPGLWKRLDRPDVAEHFHDQKLVQSGFTMVIPYDTPEEARRALAATRCLAVRGTDDTVSYLPLDVKKGCGS